MKEENVLKIKFKQSVISTKNPDNTILLNNKEILKIVKIGGTLIDLHIQGHVYEKKNYLYTLIHWTHRY